MFDLIENRDMDGIVNYLLVRAAIVLLCWSLIIVANFMDFYSGRDAAKSVGEKLDSKGYRRTFTKIGDYYRVLVFALLFDLIGCLFTFYKLPFVSILGSVAVISIEFISVIENCRKKKSHAADVPEIVKKIIQCSTTKSAEAIIENIKKEIDGKK